MKKNIVMTIKRINKNIINEDFIKNENYNKFEKDFYYNKEVAIKDLSFIINILFTYFNKIKIILLLIIFLIITIYYFFYNNNSKLI